jgi:hypothetical protein
VSERVEVPIDLLMDFLDSIPCEPNADGMYCDRHKFWMTLGLCPMWRLQSIIEAHKANRVEMCDCGHTRQQHSDTSPHTCVVVYGNGRFCDCDSWNGPVEVSK